MKIGELSERTGLAASRIRFYESIGLLKMVKRERNGYRIYPPEAVTVLSLISRAQKAGFSLDELRTLLPSDFTHWDHDSLLSALRQKVGDITELQDKLAQSKALLLEVLAEIEAKPDDMDCADNAKRVLEYFSVGKETPSDSPSDSENKRP